MSERRGVVPWKVLDLVWALLFIALVLVPALGLTRVVATFGSGTPALSVAFILSTLVAESAIGVSVWVFAIRKYRVDWSEVGFRPLNCSGLVSGVLVLLFGIAVNIIYVVATRALHLERILPPPVLPPFARQPLVMAVLAFLSVVLAPLVEEAFFRGFAFPALSKRLGYFWGAAGSAALFSLAHAQPGAFIPIFILGLALVWLFKSTSSLWPCVLVHSAYNLLGLVAGLARLQ